MCLSILSAAVEDLGRSFATRWTDGLQQTTGGLKKIYLQKMCHILKKKFTMNLYNFWQLIMYRHQYLDTIMANCKVFRPDHGQDWLHLGHAQAPHHVLAALSQNCLLVHFRVALSIAHADEWMNDYLYKIGFVGPTQIK